MGHLINIHARVDAAIKAANQVALPFVPSHAQVAQELAPLVDDILQLNVNDIVALFRLHTVRPGTWDVHVLAEVKAALWLARGDLSKK